MLLKNKKILVTGGAGFIGSHIVDSLVREGAKVTVYDDFSSGSMENLSVSKNRIRVIRGNILDLKKLLNACRGIDVISHQAAQLEILKCIDNPVEDLRVNTEGSLNVFNAAVKCSVEKVVYASSACVYGQAQSVPENESHVTSPNWPYGVSKLAVEKYAKIYNEYYGIRMTGLRYGIVYGPREWYGRVITIFLKRALESKPPVVWGGGTQERDFIFVSDVVDFHNLCIKSDRLNCELFNVSTGQGTRISRLAELVSRSFGMRKPIYEKLREGRLSAYLKGRRRLPAELKQMVLDNGKARRITGWKPAMRLEEGIILEYDWLLNNTHRWKKMMI